VTPDEAAQVKELGARVLATRRDSFRIFLGHDDPGAPRWGEECLKHIEYLGFMDRPTLAADATGRMNTEYMIWREGRRSLAIEIRRHVQALKEPAPKTQERAVSALAGG
jgi:hypothetical protein